MSCRHFLSLLDLSLAEVNAILGRAAELKRLYKSGIRPEIFRNKVLAMLFEKSSTRTRVSFEAAIAQGGGGAIFLAPRDIQLSRGESIADSARVLGRMVDAVIIRTYAHDRLQSFAAHCQVPVLNALTDRFHPCQLLADLQTWQEHRGPIVEGKIAAWIGDGNNMCNTYIHAAQLFGFELRICSPNGYEPSMELVREAHGLVRMVADPLLAVQNAQLIITDVWASMGQEEEYSARASAFSNYQVDRRIMEAAAPNALFMHCLPAHRGEEVTAEVIDGPNSVVWEEAENRLHSQKALLEFLLQ